MEIAAIVGTVFGKQDGSQEKIAEASIDLYRSASYNAQNSTHCCTVHLVRKGEFREGQQSKTGSVDFNPFK